jgi:hypothetical protein
VPSASSPEFPTVVTAHRPMKDRSRPGIQVPSHFANSTGVQIYPTKHVGLWEASLTLQETQPGYAAIRTAFMDDDGPSGATGSGPGWAVITAIINSVWGAGSLLRTVYADFLSGSLTTITTASTTGGCGGTVV